MFFGPDPKTRSLQLLTVPGFPKEPAASAHSGKQPLPAVGLTEVVTVSFPLL